MDIKQLERKRAELDQKIRFARQIEAKKAKFAAMVASRRPDLLDLNETEIKALILPTPASPAPESHSHTTYPTTNPTGGISNDE